MSAKLISATSESASASDVPVIDASVAESDGSDELNDDSNWTTASSRDSLSNVDKRRQLERSRVWQDQRAGERSRKLKLAVDAL